MVVLKARGAPPEGRATPSRAGGAPSGPFETGRGAETTPFSASAPASIARAESHTVEELRVTGTLVRGARAKEAPGLVLGREDLLQTGHATLAGALNTLPQVFGGRSTEATSLLNSDRSGTNGALATGVNLRGLGSDATLVLVDGRRLAGSGLKGDFADVSSIPSIAIERVEILLDGASALYGSDAVGGVVNIILRDDFEGGQLRARGGAARAGEPREGLVAGLIGHRWETGSGLIAVEAYQREALAAADRPYTATADLRPLGAATGG
ncbi:TonB-dependent siderophore receptor [Phenylobacterium sp. J367]|uniref:TonB-dependent receptor plug domain-containing protein n=1 Tax=Phenylobacterium sp. J367 TaxID=2898435 RepID=UPI00215099D7|nr:TonB-dependent receptor plug domain-containing protein [Phenylobacterium sp. J367]MCR5879460.1 TonB-dependent receptor plug domain-containing protein [Phenylobacterium sp. J367]